MKRVERIKIFTGEDTDELEEMFATWYDDIVEQRANAPVTKGQPIVIRERSITIRNYEGDETFALAVFYEDFLLEDFESGRDKGRHLKNGVSMVMGKKK